MAVNLKFLSVNNRYGYIPFEELEYLIKEKGISILPFKKPPSNPAN